MKAPAEKREPRLTLLLIAVTLGVLAIHAWDYLPFIADDALISLRYAKRLIEGQGLTWNAGEHVEGYSNLLWLLGAAALGLFRIDLITAVRILGFLGMSAAMAAVLYAHPPKKSKGALITFLLLLFLPLSAPIAAWTIGGMEQPMVAGLLAWAVVLCYSRLEQPGQTARNMFLPGLLFGLLCLTRSDGVLFAVATALAVLLVRRGGRQGWRQAFGLFLFPVLFLLLQQIFRLAYYGEWVPNTALVKFTPSIKHALDGWVYVRAGAFPILPLLIAAGSSLLLSFTLKFRRPRMTLLFVLAISWTAYLILIGGDIFPAWRHFVPLLVLLVLMAASGGDWLAERANRRRHLLAISIAGVLFLGIFFFLQRRDSENLRAMSERWEWDGKAVGLLLKQAFGDRQPLMAVDPAGCLPFWSELPAIDMLGLNDYYLPRHPPANFGEGPIAHELGDGKYVLDRRPDLVIFLLPTGNDRGYFRSGLEMQEDPRFFREYSLTRFETAEPHRVVSRIWVRKYSERIGIQRLAGLITIPAFLLNENGDTVARLGAGGELIITISREVPARAARLELPPGRWRIEAQASQSDLRVRVFSSLETGDGPTTKPSEADRMLLDARMPAVLDWENMPGQTIKLEVLPDSGETVEVRQVTLTRLSD